MFMSENIGLISKIPRQKNSFCWEVPNYFACQLDEGYEVINPHIIYPGIVSSPLFSAFNNKWRLALILNGERRLNIFVGFFLWRMTSSNERPNINVNLLLLSSDGATYEDSAGDVDLNGSFGRWTFLYLSSLSEDNGRIAPSGVLKFVCKMEVKVPIAVDTAGGSEGLGIEEEKIDENVTSGGGVEKDIPEAKGVDLLVQNLKNIFLEEQGCDAILKVEGRDFKAHKAILIARSPVFASMFKHDTRENTTGEVDIPDCLATAFEVFLLYLYTASTATMSEDNVYDLYYAADKYQVNDLKSECIEYMKNNLSIENFCTVMTLSLKHNQSGLQNKAMDFFCDNVKAILKTVQWKNFLRDYPDESNELYMKAIDA